MSALLTSIPRAGDIPGLLCRGAAVLYLDSAWRRDQTPNTAGVCGRQVVNSAHPDGAWWVDGVLMPAWSLALDLTDPTSRWHAMCWLLANNIEGILQVAPIDAALFDEIMRAAQRRENMTPDQIHALASLVIWLAVRAV